MRERRIFAPRVLSLPSIIFIEYYNEIVSHSNDKYPYTLYILISYDIQTDQTPIVYFHLHCESVLF